MQEVNSVSNKAKKVDSWLIINNVAAYNEVTFDQ